MHWNDASEVTPADARPCVIVVPTSHGFYERHFGQFQAGRWFYMGSDSPARGVAYWLPLPQLPEVPR